MGKVLHTGKVYSSGPVAEDPLIMKVLFAEGPHVVADLSVVDLPEGIKFPAKAFDRIFSLSFV